MNVPEYTGKNEIIWVVYCCKIHQHPYFLKALSIATQNKHFYSLRDLADFIFLDLSGSFLWDSPGL